MNTPPFPSTPHRSTNATGGEDCSDWVHLWLSIPVVNLGWSNLSNFYLLTARNIVNRNFDIDGAFVFRTAVTTWLPLRPIVGKLGQPDHQPAVAFAARAQSPVTFHLARSRHVVLSSYVARSRRMFPSGLLAHSRLLIPSSLTARSWSMFPSLNMARSLTMIPSDRLARSVSLFLSDRLARSCSLILSLRTGSLQNPVSIV
jgi:hypothetical protein